MADMECDVAVIGAGTAGLSAERAARELGARTLLIDATWPGTTCASVGCMPSKLLIAAAHVAHTARNGASFGVEAPPRIDGRAVMARVQSERDRFVAGVKRGYEALPDGVAVTGRARFTGPSELTLDDGRRISARAVVVATGSAPSIPGPYRDLGDKLVTTDQIFELDDLPRRLGVIGAGVIGLELAQAFARLGVEVSVFDMADKLSISRSDAVNDALESALRDEMSLNLGHAPTPRIEGGEVVLEWGEDGRCAVDLVLVATGRPPRLDGLDLAASGAQLDEKGRPEIDADTLQMKGAPIYIAGDANAMRPLLHEASMEGTVAGRNAVRHPDAGAVERLPFFALTFTDPPVASLGAGPQEAAGLGVADYSNQGRARTMGKAHGLAEIYADAEGRLIGADLCAPGGEHLAHELVWAVMEGISAAQMLRRPFYHPTLEEGLKPALRQICQCSGKEEPTHRNRSTPPGS